MRQKKPGSLPEATRLAEEYFHYNELSYTGWSSRTEGSGQEQVQSQKRERYHRHGWRRDLLPRQQRRDNPPHSDESRKEDKDNKQAPPQESRDSPRPSGNNRGQQTGRGRGGQGSSIKCFACGELGHIQASCPNKPSKVNRVEAQVQCQLCDGLGHGAKDCPSKVNRVGLTLGGAGD